MIPTLFPADYIGPMDPTSHFPTFPLHGTVDLNDCIECVAEETEDEDGSEWELAFTYPLGGYGFDQLVMNAIVLAKVNDHQDPQAFRIYSIEKNIAKTVSVKCQHISYDLINIPVKNYKATDAAAAISGLQSNAVSKTGKFQNRFYITTDIVNSDDFTLDTPTSMRAALLDGENSIKGTYGGDLVFDNYRIELKQVGGHDRDVTINYGVDLIDMTQEENISEMVTGVLGYYKRSTNDEQYETDSIIYASDISYGPGTYTVQRIEPVDLSEHFPNNVPTPAQIKAKADQWVTKEKIGEPEISLTVQYATLGQDVRIHDAICVKFPKLFTDPKGYKAKVVKYKYNVLFERCEEIEVGHAKAGSLFNLMDASKLRKGLIPPARIQNESITNIKIAKGGVGAGKLAPNSVSTGNVELGAIDHNRLSGAGGVGEPAVQSDVIDTGAVTNEKIGRGAVTGEKIDSKAVGRSHIDDKAVSSGQIDNSAVKEGNIDDAAVAWAKLKTGSGQPATKINALETDMAYVNKLFASSAQIDFIRVKALYADTASIGGNITATGNGQFANVNGSSLTVRNSGNIQFKGITFDRTINVESTSGVIVTVIAS